MLIVDSHCHTSPYWAEPVEILLEEMNRNGVDKAVLTQLSGVYDHSYLIECKRRYPRRFSVAVIVDPERPDAPDEVERWVNEGARALRIRLPMPPAVGDPSALWRKAAELGIPVTCVGTKDEFASAEFEQVVKGFPNLTIVIEHLGHAGQPDRETSPPFTDYSKVLGLASYSNTFMKVPGLGEICPRPVPLRQPVVFQDVPPVIEMAIEAFGPKRLMWGSDFPPVASREGYRNALQFPMEQVSFKSEEDREWVFGKTAMSVWNFDES